jgi:hypothetical protein
MRASFAAASKVFSRSDNLRQADRIDCFVQELLIQVIIHGFFDGGWHSAIDFL